MDKYNVLKREILKRKINKEEILDLTICSLDTLSNYCKKAIQGSMQYRIGKDVINQNYNILRDEISKREESL